jgi:hypothetical protein
MLLTLAREEHYEDAERSIPFIEYNTEERKSMPRKRLA